MTPYTIRYDTGPTPLETFPAVCRAEMEQIGRDLLRRLPIESIFLIPMEQTVSRAGLRERFPTGPVVVCDCYIGGQELGTVTTGGIELDGILNVDHHAPLRVMERHISSGNLAIEYATVHGPVDPAVPVIINHTDCDSVISSAIMRAILPPHPEFGRVVVAADHTGDPHPIADLLQSMDVKRDLNFSLRNLGLLLTGQPLEAEAQRLLAVRTGEREIAKGVAESGSCVRVGPVVLVQTDVRVSGEFFPPLFPDCQLIVAASGGADGRYEMKVRLGKGAPEGFSISRLDIPGTFDPGYGGRWNSGANKRGNGTTILPYEYSQLLAARVAVVSASHEQFSSTEQG